MRKIVVVAIVLALGAVGYSVGASGWTRPQPVFDTTSVSFTSPHLPDVWRLNLRSGGQLLATATEPDSGTITIVLPTGVCTFQADASRIIGTTFQYYSGARYQVPGCGTSPTTTAPLSTTTTTEAPTTTTTLAPAVGPPGGSPPLPPPVHYPTAPVIIVPATGPTQFGGNGRPGQIDFTG